MIKTHLIGLPSIGKNRELKEIIERIFYKSNKYYIIFYNRIKKIILYNIYIQNKLDIITIGFFNYYDRIYITMFLLGFLPKRFLKKNRYLTFIDFFKISKGYNNKKTLNMYKWYNTNYHYLTPEIDNSIFNKKYNTDFLLYEIELLKNYKNNKKNYKYTIIGPYTFLKLCNIKINLNRKILNLIVRRYYLLINKIFKKYKYINWLQFEESYNIKKYNDINLFYCIYKSLLSFKNIKTILILYSNANINNLRILKGLNFFIYHFDIYLIKDILVFERYNCKRISLGIIKANNIWRSNYKDIINRIIPIKIKNIFISFDNSLMFIPYSLNKEKESMIKYWLTFSLEKVIEINEIKNILIYGINLCYNIYKKNKTIINNIINNKSFYYKDIRRKINNKIIELIKNYKHYYNNYNKFKLPILPFTTIGSFPQTKALRICRSKFKKNQLSFTNYKNILLNKINKLILFQKNNNIDILVHGEYERTDMVEYFCRSMNGCFITRNGWVQSYGTRYIKPPIIFGDISIKNKHIFNLIYFTIKKSNSLVKAIITGPITIIKWSFLRNDLKINKIAYQIAFSLRKYIKEFIYNDIKIIQIDEPGYQEGIPESLSKKIKYFKWTKIAFRLIHYGFNKNFQIHSHICYSKINKSIIKKIYNLGIDVISIEASKNIKNIIKILSGLNIKMEYGIGIYDVHSLNINSKNYYYNILKYLVRKINYSNIWINPDCGLKTRNWKEVKENIRNISISILKIRKELNK